jgi:hypothetical protein
MSQPAFAPGGGGSDIQQMELFGCIMRHSSNRRTPPVCVISTCQQLIGALAMGVQHIGIDGDLDLTGGKGGCLLPIRISK